MERYFKVIHLFKSFKVTNLPNKISVNYSLWHTRTFARFKLFKIFGGYWKHVSPQSIEIPFLFDFIIFLKNPLAWEAYCSQFCQLHAWSIRIILYWKEIFYYYLRRYLLFCVCVVDKKDKLFRNTAVWLNHKEKLFILYFLGKEKKFYLQNKEKFGWCLPGFPLY